MEQGEIKEVLRLHELWLNGSKEGKQANLRGADIRRADLREADLRRADLEGADLRGANLLGADLEGADIRGADLRRADLRRADLRRADLREAYLAGANLRGAYMSMFCKWSHSVIDGKIQIGCETRSPEEWEQFLESDEVIETPRDTDEFKQIEAVIRAYIAYLK